MSDTNWISSKEAVLRARQAGWCEGDLAQWAEDGRLRSRAARGRFSDDEDGIERQLTLPSDPEELQHELASRSASGSPWPDIPCDFWHWFNNYSQSHEAHWGAGVFSTKVHFETQVGPHGGSQHIRLFDVSFCAEDLAKLLGAMIGSQLRGTLPPSAKPAHRKVEDQAHRAAEIIRQDGVTIAQAARIAAAEFPAPPIVLPASYETSIRRSFDLMYDKKGKPIKKDQN